MQKTKAVSPCDECDGKIIKINSPQENERQRRFLDAYRQHPTVASAARIAGIHRSTVYRWLADPAFTAAMRDACEAFYEAHRAMVLADVAARQRWRAEGELARRPMRCFHLARARAAKRQ